jgi:DNA-binding beta-propeller fold protein YncE
LACICSVCQVVVAQDSPRFKLDLSWPKELPNNWILGQVRGLAVDPQNHIWVLNEGVPNDNASLAQNPPTARCCIPAPLVIEFDRTGKVLRHWGRPGFVADWPTSPHGIAVDKKGNVWIAGVGSPWNTDPGTSRPKTTQPWDRQVLKFSNTGKLLLEIGKPSNAKVDNRDTSLLGAPSAIAIDDAANEVYIADGFLNHRIVVFDANTGKFKRGWGAYGVPLADIDNGAPVPFPASRDLSVPASRQFKGVTDIALSRDGLVYVPDQLNDRIQVFTRQGKFVREFTVAPLIPGYESTWSVALSRDPKQKYVFVTEGASGVVLEFDRQSGAQVGSFGHKGRNAGQFDNLGWIAVDSLGTIFTGEVHFDRSWDGHDAALGGKAETAGGRLQAFVMEK